MEKAMEEVEKRLKEISETVLTDSEKEEALHEWRIRKWRKERHKEYWSKQEKEIKTKE